MSARVLNALTQPSEDDISSGVRIFMSGDICICAPKHGVSVPYSLSGSLHQERVNFPLLRVYINNLSFCFHEVTESNEYKEFSKQKDKEETISG